MQDLAIRCIQRNFRVFLKVKDWPWWRLLVRITPLLDVNRTDEQLKVALSELQSLKQKLEKSDAERNFLKNENEKLECKVSSLSKLTFNVSKSMYLRFPFFKIFLRLSTYQLMKPFLK